MAKVTIPENVATMREVDVEFPLYMEHSDSLEATFWETVSRLEGHGRMVDITCSDRSSSDSEWSLHRRHVAHKTGDAFGKAVARFLEAPSTAARFEEFKARLEAAIKSI